MDQGERSRYVIDRLQYDEWTSFRELVKGYDTELRDGSEHRWARYDSASASLSRAVRTLERDGYVECKRELVPSYRDGSGPPRFGLFVRRW